MVVMIELQVVVAVAGDFLLPGPSATSAPTEHMDTILVIKLLAVC